MPKHLMLEAPPAGLPDNLSFLTVEELAGVTERMPNLSLGSPFWTKISSAQGIYYRPGTMTCAEQLRGEFTKLPLYASPSEAREVYQAHPSAHEFYTFQEQGDLWWIGAVTPSTFQVATDRRWNLLFHERGTLLEFSFEELVEALRALSLLNGTLTEQEVFTKIRTSRPQRRLVTDLLETGDVASVDGAAPVQTPRLQFLGHSCLFVQSLRGAIIVDPALTGSHRGRFDSRAFRCAAEADAVLITHNHWDHLNPNTLVRIPRDKPIYVPRSTTPTFANPPIAPYLRLLGFTNVTEVCAWQAVQIADIEVTFAPFRGEPFGLGSSFDAFTYVIRVQGRTLYSSVDGCHDELGTMDPIISEIAQRERIDYFFFGSSGNRFSRAAHAGYPWRFSNDIKKRPELLRMHPTPEDARRWARVLKPRYSIPFAEFIWDGMEAADLTLDPALTGGCDPYDQYWEQRARGSCVSAWPEEENVLSVWKQALDQVRPDADMNLVMLHPMQSILL